MVASKRRTSLHGSSDICFPPEPPQIRNQGPAGIHPTSTILIRVDTPQQIPDVLYLTTMSLAPLSAPGLCPCPNLHSPIPLDRASSLSPSRPPTCLMCSGSLTRTPLPHVFPEFETWPEITNSVHLNLSRAPALSSAQHQSELEQSLQESCCVALRYFSQLNRSPCVNEPVLGRDGSDFLSVSTQCQHVFNIQTQLDGQHG